MGKKQTKGKRGEVTLYITRSKAIKKLGQTLKDFRRLCILKGVYPREPKKKFAGNTKTYYSKKDINFLMTDKILRTQLEMKVFLKKSKRAKKLGEDTKSKGLLKRMPKLELSHIIKERYPSFTDAIRDLDDCLSLINLFAHLPSHRMFKIPASRVQKCQKVQREFNYYCLNSGSLKKVFISIKGIYFQCEIEGQMVIWVQPHEFSQNLPYDVDYRVMFTFLEFYDTLMKFVLFKLYSSQNMVYPPAVLKETVDEQNFSYNSIITENANLNQEDKAEDNKYQISDEFHSDPTVNKILSKNQNSAKNGIFTGMVFFLSSEVPRTAFEFMILAYGGKTLSDCDNFESETYKDTSITHVVTDRPAQSLNLDSRREYIQPQWVADSINNDMCLPLADYKPGKPLPPHLSPFVVANKDEYIPDRLKELHAIKGEELDQEEEESSGEEEEDDDNEDQVEEDYLEEEVAYDAEAELKQNTKQSKKDVEESKDQKKQVLSKKLRRVMDKISYGKDRKQELKDKLKAKKKLLKTK